MAKSILNIQKDNRQNKHSLKGFARSIAHSFKTTNERLELNKTDTINKTDHKNLFYFKDKIFTNERNITKDIVSQLEQELEPFKQQWEQPKKNGTRNIPWTKMINGANTSNIFNETIIEISNDFHQDIDRADINFYEKFFQRELEIYKANFKKASGKDINIIGATLHLDETTPHIHLFSHNVYLEKDTRSKEARYKVSFKLSNRDQLSKLHDLQQERIKVLARENNIQVEVEALNKIVDKPLSEKYKRKSLFQMKQEYEQEKIKVEINVKDLEVKNEKALEKSQKLILRNEELDKKLDLKERELYQLEKDQELKELELKEIGSQLENMKWWNWLSKRKNLNKKNIIQKELQDMNSSLYKYQNELMVENNDIERIKEMNKSELERQRKYIKENTRLIESEKYLTIVENENEKLKRYHYQYQKDRDRELEYEREKREFIMKKVNIDDNGLNELMKQEKRRTKQQER